MRANSHLRLQIECVPLAYFCGSVFLGWLTQGGMSACLFVCLFEFAVSITINWNFYIIFALLWLLMAILSAW